MDNIAASDLELGHRSLLARTDTKHAHRQTAVNCQDRVLLGLHWEGKYFIDATLQFGLRLAPPIFSVVAGVDCVANRSRSHLPTISLSLVSGTAKCPLPSCY